MNTDSLLLLIDDQTISDKQGQQAAVSKIHDCFGLCNVMIPPPVDPPPLFERLFYEDFNGGFRFKGVNNL